MIGIDNNYILQLYQMGLKFSPMNRIRGGLLVPMVDHVVLLLSEIHTGFCFYLIPYLRRYWRFKSPTVLDKG